VTCQLTFPATCRSAGAFMSDIAFRTPASMAWALPRWVRGTSSPNLAVVLTHCGQLILRKKTSKFVAARCQILRVKCTKFDFLWGSAPDPAGGAYSALPDPLAVFKGA